MRNGLLLIVLLALLSGCRSASVQIDHHPTGLHVVASVSK